MKVMKTKSYRELILLETFEERLKYLQLNGAVGMDTFGSYRKINQAFYKSREWLNLRNQIILRDKACDLGVENYDLGNNEHEIYSNVIIHHINPLTIEDIINRTDKLLDPDNLITTSLDTHNSIHYGGESYRYNRYVERSPDDTCPWRRR